MSTLRNAPYHHGDLRRALLDAALLILERDGEASLGLRELARAVGVSPAAPYRHFDSRAALLEALAVIGFTRFTAAMEAAAAADAPARSMGETYVRFARDNANLFRLMFSPQLRRDNRPGLRMAADAAYQTLRHIAGENRLAAIGAWSRVHGLAILLLDGQIRLEEGEDLEALVAAVLAQG
jgi:AcrR family transcriptional regulator